MKKLLVFQHILREQPSHIADYASDRNVELNVVKFWENPTIPAVSEYDGLIVLGGPMGVYDDFPWKEKELDAIRENIGNLPILGICLGAQLIAHAMGAKVYPHVVDGKHIKEVGHYKVELTAHGKKCRLFRGFPDALDVLQWHGDTFDLPEDASHVARADMCENQGFCHGQNIHGLQFHVEITAKLLRTIAEEDAEWAHRDFDLDEEQLLREADELEPIMKTRCYQLMDNFLSA